MENIKVLKIDQFKQEHHEIPFYANTISNHLATSHLHISKPHKHNFYAAILFTRGNGIHDIDFNRYEVNPGSVFLLAPGQTHHWELSSDIEGFIFFHTQAFYDLHFVDEKVKDFPFFSQLQQTQALLLPDDVLPLATSLFKRIFDEEKSEKLRKESYILSLVSQVYIELSRVSASQNEKNAVVKNQYHAKFSTFEKLVEAHFLTEKSPEQYAKWMSMTAKHLNRINKAVLNKTTSDIIMDRVLLEAKRMLIYSHNNLSEIAFALGYNDYAYFSKLFKKKTGETPSDFLKKQQ